jgi:hypothetical protein
MRISKSAAATPDPVRLLPASHPYNPFPEFRLKGNPVKKNLGRTDRTVRVILAVVIGLLALTGTLSGTTAIVLGVVSALLLLTSAISFCPVYFPLNISTRKQAENK